MPSPGFPSSLLAGLEDPFEIMPLISALETLAEIVERDAEALYGHHAWDDNPRHRGVEVETRLEAVSILLGAGFVAAQAIIYRTRATLREIKQDAASCITETGMTSLYEIGGPASDIVGIDTLANYFKHNGEWATPWESEPSARKALALGLRWNHPDNIFIGAENIGFGGRDGLTRVAQRLLDWRTALATEIRRRAGLLEDG